jgi:hypothetical protein
LEICRFIYDICYNAYRHDSGYGQIRRQQEVLPPPVPRTAVVIILMLAHTKMMRRLYDAKSGIHDVE